MSADRRNGADDIRARVELAEGQADAAIVDVRGLAKEMRRRLDKVDEAQEKLSDRLEWHAQQLNYQIAGVEKSASERGHKLRDDISAALTAFALELRNMRSELALTKVKARDAQRVAEEARASRPDDGRLDELAARAIEHVVDQQAIENERKRESIRAKAERRTAVLRWVGQALLWATFGGGIALAATFC